MDARGLTPLHGRLCLNLNLVRLIVVDVSGLSPLNDRLWLNSNLVLLIFHGRQRLVNFAWLALAELKLSVAYFRGCLWLVAFARRVPVALLFFVADQTAQRHE